MQIHRLTQIVFALLKNEIITAKVLADRFEVSTRTIYRDIDVLSAAGIPIYTDKGNGGGILINENYRLNNAILSDNEKQNIITMLTAFNASVKNKESDALLEKLSSVFKTANNFIEVDFTNWHNDNNIQRNFDIFKKCIIEKRVAFIDYCNASGDYQARTIEPLKLVFKDRNWYVYAYCRKREENRLFKIARVHKLEILEEKFLRVCTDCNIAHNLEWKGDNVEVSFILNKKMKSYVYENVDRNSVVVNNNGDFFITMNVPMDDWIMGFFLSFGDYVTIENPSWLKDKIKQIHKRAAEL